jgi:hypothetical protein
MTNVRISFIRGILSIVGVGFLLIWPTSGYGGEWQPVVPNIINGTLVIEIKNKQFTNPGTGKVSDHLLVIPEGMEVKWVNMDPLVTVNGKQGLMPHGIQLSDESEEAFTASPLLTREKNAFTYGFESSGTYTYDCFIHPFMKGKIVVVNIGHH